MNYANATQDGRALLNSLGIGDFNATMLIPYLFLTPATTDPDMPPVQMLVETVQAQLQAMGAPVSVNGLLEKETAAELRKLTGPNWPGMMWSQILETVLRAKMAGRRLHPTAPARGAVAVGFLPELPAPFGSPVVLGVAALGIYLLLRGKR